MSPVKNLSRPYTYRPQASEDGSKRGLDVSYVASRPTRTGSGTHDSQMGGECGGEEGRRTEGLLDGGRMRYSENPSVVTIPSAHEGLLGS